jgi:hypothetical protein
MENIAKKIESIYVIKGTYRENEDAEDWEVEEGKDREWIGIGIGECICKKK